jgi:hypothetical protein
MTRFISSFRSRNRSKHVVGKPITKTTTAAARYRGCGVKFGHQANRIDHELARAVGAAGESQARTDPPGVEAS